MNKEKLFVFIWYGDDVLRDWTPGQIVVIAHNLDEALKLIDDDSGFTNNEFPRDKPTKVIEVAEEAECEVWLNWGGA